MITFGILETISRSSMIAMAISVLVLMPLSTSRRRYNVGIFGAAMLVALTGASPMIGRTISKVFADAGTDPSITSRTQRYAMVGTTSHSDLVRPRPEPGSRRTSTWTTRVAAALENGIVGVAMLALLHIIALSLAVIALRRASTAEDRHLCLAMVAVQLGAIFIAYTFDVLAYSTYTTMLGIMIGVCGAVWRFAHPARQVRTSMAMVRPVTEQTLGQRPARRPLRHRLPIRSRWLAVALAAIVAAGVTVSAVLAAHTDTTTKPEAAHSGGAVDGAGSPSNSKALEHGGLGTAPATPTPTPTPTPTRAAAPPRSGGGAHRFQFPDTNCTGPAGTLKTYNGPLTFNTPVKSSKTW